MAKKKVAQQDDILAEFQNLKRNVDIPKKLTVIPLKDILIYPYMIYPVLIGRASSLRAVAEAIDRDKFIFVSAQKNASEEDASLNSIYQYGTVGKIIQVLRLPNNLLKVLIEGYFHAKITRPVKNENCLEANITVIKFEHDPDDQELTATIRHASELFVDYVKSNNSLPGDLISAFNNIEDPIRKLYYAAANINSKIEDRQLILEQKTLKAMYLQLTAILISELELLKLESEIDHKVQDQIQKTQKKYYIQEQIRALQKELGDDDESMPEIALLKEMIEKAQLPPHALKKANEEIDRLRKTPMMSPEFTVNRTYLELMTQIPWVQRTADNLNVEHVKTVLDEDHYDLEKPKDRILEFISVLNLAGSLKKQILCFVGPPGTGKTSLARSIARALGRKFVRFSLGGVRDEAEIRGHRRTYIGSMPGKIIQSMKKAETINPVILLDEIDKMAHDFRGDPSSALLEVLDPEQNTAFNDHYLEVDYDLSNVLFITTANVKFDIPEPLLDRMEVIELSSYLDPDKLEIAKRHIIPKFVEEYGMKNIDVEFKDEAVMKLIQEYTREAGVRNLERSVQSVLRKLTKEIVENFDKNKADKASAKKAKAAKIENSENEENLEQESSKDLTIRTIALKDDKEFQKYIAKQKFIIDSAKIEKFLKTPKFKIKKDDLQDKIGVATGLAWTSVGGDTLPVEVTIMPGAEKLTLTGKLGDVMKESATAALTYVRSNLDLLGINENFNKNKEIHIHVPEGAIPKDGPSAGITMTLALISAAKQIPMRGDLAMTGEITLRGNILPIGGLNEKLLAAKKMGIKTVLIPYENLQDIEEISMVIKENLEIIAVKHLSDALPIAFPNWEKSTQAVTISVKKSKKA
jgi:ATP-dependent Lon protease